MNTAAIKSFLDKKHISVPDQWISACVDFLKEEHKGNNRVKDANFMVEKVYEQWLHSDLTQLASCSLPFGLQNKKLATVNGSHALQVNKIKDVGLPAYGQIQKIRKDDVANASISADKPNQAAWEPKACRMLMMEMTDGTSVIKGMEYQPIPSLSLTMKPGCKILVSGAIEARRGVLLLKQQNVTILGGEVDELLVPNAPENVLCRALGLDENENPIPISDSLLDVSVQPSQSSQYYPSQASQLGGFQPPPLQQQRSSNSVISSSQNASISRKGPLQHPPTNSFVRHPASSSQPPPGDIESDDIDFLDPSIEKALLEAEQNAVSLPKNNQRPFKVPLAKGPKSTAPLASSCGSNRSFKVPSTAPICASLNAPTAVASDSSSRPASTEKLSVIRTASHFGDDFDDDDDDLFMQIPTDFALAEKPAMRPTQALAVASVPPSIHAQSRSAAFSRTISDKPSSSFGSESSELPRSGVPPLQNPVEGFKEKTPFQYLCFLPSNPSSKLVFTVKAFVMTLLSKLTHETGFYQLTVNLNDGTASCEVDFHDKVIEQIMGLSAKDLTAQKKAAIADAALRPSFLQRLSQCQKELISLSCLFRIEVMPRCVRPIVTDLIPVNIYHFEQLSGRMNIL